MSVLDHLAINPRVVRQLLVNFIRQEVGKTGYPRGVVGLSGGVDSSLVAYLAAEALGKENLVGVLMPYRTSDPQSEADAQTVVAALGIPSRRLEITGLVEPYFAACPGLNQRRRGNIMARARMLVLYDQAADVGGLVIGTSNRTETLLGYTTVYGDNAAAIHPIADLFKAQVRQLATAVGVPQGIVHKAPSADLWAGQTDEGELGFTYNEADQILFLLYDQRHPAAEVAALGFDAGLVQRIVQLVQRNQFKRQPPVIAKVGPRTVGLDFLYARDWGT